MAEHFKLEISNKSVKITTWTGVDADFADKFKNNLDSYKDDDIDNKPMTDAMATVFADTEKLDSDADNNKTAKKVTGKAGAIEGKYKTYNYSKRVKTRRARFKNLAYINFATPNIQFVTLTFDSRVFSGADDLDTCHKAFQKFIKRVRHSFDDFKYLAVFSRQQNKHWHYHMICNFDENVSGRCIHDLWSYGVIHNTVLTRFSEFETKISYCIDNMEKVSWDDLQGEKGYLSCKGLQSSIVLRSWNDDEAEAAREFLKQILESDDKPLPLNSVKVEVSLSDYEAKRLNLRIGSKKSFRINYLVVQKGFGELFDTPVVAKKK